jgi:tetratricopeptide (TPR) repeat protein
MTDLTHESTLRPVTLAEPNVADPRNYVPLERTPPSEPAADPIAPRRRRRIALAITAFALVVIAGVMMLRPDDKPGANSLLSSGLQAHLSGDITKARTFYVRAIEQDPQNAWAYYNLGLVDQTQGNIVDATKAYELAIGIDRGLAPALFNLGVLRGQESDKTAAIELYRRAIQSDPKLAGAHFNLGLLLIESGEVAEGKSEITAGVELDPALRQRIPAHLQL